MLLANRTIFSDNGTLNDFSVAINNFKSQESTLPFVAAEDFLYLGSELPFNHRWFEMGATLNDQAADLTIDLWEGDEWVPAVDIVDQTVVGGVPLAQSGYISWTTDKDETWTQEDTQDCNDDEEVIGLGDIKIFDMYWARLKWSADLNAGTAIKYLGHKFSDEDHLEIFYPDLITSHAKEQFKAGKTDWKEQEFQAAREIIRYLTSRKVIKSADQILDWELFADASAHKIASLAFNAYGKDWIDEKKQAHTEFKMAMDREIFRMDKNRNARLDDRERFKSSGTLIR